MKRSWLFAALALLGAIALWVHWPRGLPRLDLPEAMTLEQLKATSDQQIIYIATTEVRYRVIAIPENMPRWRNLPEPARNLLALSWTEGDDSPGTPDRFRGFGDFFGLNGPYLATPEDIAKAYEAIGAPAVAEVMRAAGQRYEQQPKPEADGETKPPAKYPYGDLDGRFREERRKAKIPGLMRAYIRTHLEEIANARL